MLAALLLLGAYLVGSIPFGVIVGRAWRGVDVRKHGSGNIGATNVLRVLGPGPAAVVLVGDALKGYLPMAAAHLMLGRPALSGVEGSLAPAAAHADLWLLAIGLAAIVGHSFSVFLGFRGGRAVTTTGGVLLGLYWPAAAVAATVFLVLVLLTRYVSVGSIAAAISVPTCMVAAGRPREWVIFWCAIAALIILRHLPNIKRLLTRTESKIGERAEVETGD